MTGRRGAGRGDSGHVPGRPAPRPGIAVAAVAAIAAATAGAGLATQAATPGGAASTASTASAARASPPGASTAARSGGARPYRAVADAAALADASAALGDLGLALLRDTPGANAVVSPLAVATVLGMVQSGAEGATEREIEALFGGARAGAQAMRVALPALSAQLRGGAAASRDVASPVSQAARVWVDTAVAKDMPGGFRRRIAQRHAADAMVLSFADAEAARAQINGWAAQHTAGRVKDLLPPGSVARSTQVALTAALHFRSAWDQPFDAGRTETRPFTTSTGVPGSVPTLNDERAIAQAVVEGTQLYALPFASGFDLVVAMPAAAGAGATAGTAAPAAPAGQVDALLERLRGATFARWHSELKAQAPVRCSFSMPKLAFAPKAGSAKASLQRLGVQRAFTDRAELRPMLGRLSGTAHVDDVHHAAGITLDEWGGEAVAAAAATVKPKSLAPALPACAVDRAFAFVVMHRASGAPLFVGRVGDPAKAQ
ncbi:MAG: hypothetical protein JNJ89_06960 [Rubrivivax sp.]|nr:hypothetical protein [Rubrivivax sp.]